LRGVLEKWGKANQASRAAAGTSTNHRGQELLQEGLKSSIIQCTLLSGIWSPVLVYAGPTDSPLDLPLDLKLLLSLIAAAIVPLPA
jgi:hypothetical protein